jgi:hypothetical protein
MAFIIPPVDGESSVLRARARRFRRRGLPSEVVEQLHAAAALCETLAAEGVELRFDAPGAGARVRAVLVDSEGEEIREVSLSDVVALELDDR